MEKTSPLPNQIDPDDIHDRTYKLCMYYPIRQFPSTYRIPKSSGIPKISMMNVQHIQLLRDLPPQITYPFDGMINTLQSLQTLSHQQISELLMNRHHSAGNLKYPLFIRIRSEIVGRCTEHWNQSWLVFLLNYTPKVDNLLMSSYVEKHIGILRSRILGSMWCRKTHD